MCLNYNQSFDLESSEFILGKLLHEILFSISYSIQHIPYIRIRILFKNKDQKLQLPFIKIHVHDRFTNVYVNMI